MSIRFLNYFILFFLLIHPTISFTQSRKSKIVEYDYISLPGKVILEDKSELIGDITFNDNEGIVTVQSGNDIRSFNSRKMLGFQFFETDSTSSKLFYSLEFEDPDTGLTDIEIFEVLKELDSFAVLVRIERLKTMGKTNVWLPKQTGAGLSQRHGIQVNQTETIFFVNANGDFEPYLKTTEKEADRRYMDLIDHNSKSSRMINASLFKKYTDQHYESLKKFAKTNDYSFRDKYDIVKILEEYQRLISFENIPK